MSHLGLLIFLAYAGGRAGSAFVDTIRSPLGIKVFLVAAAITAFHAAGLLLVARWLHGMSGPRLAGMIAGSQTQPAVLAYANHRTTYDQRVALGYPLVYPPAMVIKILIAQILASMEPRRRRRRVSPAGPGRAEPAPRPSAAARPVCRPTA